EDEMKRDGTMAPLPNARLPWLRIVIVAIAVGALVGGVVLAMREPTSVLGRAIPTPDVAAPRGTPDPIVRIPGASWVAPSRNSVYVVDPNPTGTESRLFLVDPQTGSARYVAEIDGNPMIARTNSGDRLVLASSMRGD